MHVDLDLTKPTIVLPGAWNTAIFIPEWIARYLHDYAEGQNVDVGILQEVPTTKSVIFIQNIGISSSPTRLEIFSQSVEQFPNLSNYVERIYDALPHTPCSTFGINFRYSTSEIAPEVIEKLETEEGLEAQFEIRRRELKTQLFRSDVSVLNLSRIYTQGSLEIGFNFHFSIDSKNDIVNALKDGAVQTCRKEAEDTLGEYYEVDDIGVVGFELPDGAN